MNKVFLVGRLASDPQVSLSKDGMTILGRSVVVTNSFVRGNRVSQFFRVVCFNKRAEHLSNSFKKGDGVAVVGNIMMKDYEKEGVKGKFVEVVVSSIEKVFNSRGVRETGTDVF